MGRTQPTRHRARRPADQEPAVVASAVEENDGWVLAGPAVLDLDRSSLTVVEELEPAVDVRRAGDWGGFMDGTLELTDAGVVWVPSEHARRFGFDAFRLEPDRVADIRVSGYGSAGAGAVDIDLTDARRIAVRVADAGRWRSALDDAVGH